MALGGSSKLLKALNEAAALGHLLDHGELTRAELRSLTGLSKPTVSEAIRRLTEAGLVVAVGHETGRPGPNAEVYAANADAAFAVAISVRDHAPAVTAALHDLRGRRRAALERAVDFAAVDPVTALGDVVAALCAEARVDRDAVAHVELAVAGAFDPRDRVLHHVDVPGWSRAGLVDDLGAHLRASVGVDNDVNQAALAERAHGAAHGVDGFALLWLGRSGLGLAIDLGNAWSGSTYAEPHRARLGVGNLLRGARGGAGEIGYIPVGDGDFHDLAGPDAVRALSARYHGGELLSQLAARIVVGLAAVVAVLDPPLVVIGGELARAYGEPLGEAVTKAMSHAAPLDTAIAVSTVDGDAPLLGAGDAAVSAVREAILERLRQPTP